MNTARPTDQAVAGLSLPAASTPSPESGRLRVALTMPPWFDVPPRGYGGIEAIVADLADDLVARGHEVVLVGAGTNGTRARFLRTFEAPRPSGSARPCPRCCRRPGRAGISTTSTSTSSTIIRWPARSPRADARSPPC